MNYTSVQSTVILLCTYSVFECKISDDVMSQEWLRQVRTEDHIVNCQVQQDLGLRAMTLDSSVTGPASRVASSGGASSGAPRVI